METAAVVGECGLHYFIPGLEPEQQTYYFTAQLQLIYNYNLLVTVYVRRAMDSVIKYLHCYPGLRGYLVLCRCCSV